MIEHPMVKRFLSAHGFNRPTMIVIRPRTGVSCVSAQLATSLMNICPLPVVSYAVDLAKDHFIFNASLTATIKCYRQIPSFAKLALLVM